MPKRSVRENVERVLLTIARDTQPRPTFAIVGVWASEDTQVKSISAREAGLTEVQHRQLSALITDTVASFLKTHAQQHTYLPQTLN